MRRRNAGGSAWPTGSPSIRTSPLSGSISRLMLLRSAKPCPPSNDLLKVSISISAPAMNFASRVHVYSGLPCPANAGHPVTRGAKKGTEPGRGAGVTGSPADAGDDRPEVALPAYANVNVYYAGRLDEQETRWQRRQI